ncbi:MAG: VOC family protein [Gaiellaceae bacterium]
MRVEGLIFAGVGSSDHAGTARFLADVLGVEVEVSGDVNRLVFENGSSLALVPPDYVEPPSDTLLGFLVDDVETATEDLARRGIEADGELLSGYGFRYRHFRAPDGRRFELLDRRL